MGISYSDYTELSGLAQSIINAHDGSAKGMNAGETASNYYTASTCPPLPTNDKKIYAGYTVGLDDLRAVSQWVAQTYESFSAGDLITSIPNITNNIRNTIYTPLSEDNHGCLVACMGFCNSSCYGACENGCWGGGWNDPNAPQSGTIDYSDRDNIGNVWYNFVGSGGLLGCGYEMSLSYRDWYPGANLCESCYNACGNSCHRACTTYCSGTCGSETSCSNTCTGGCNTGCAGGDCSGNCSKGCSTICYGVTGKTLPLFY